MSEHCGYIVKLNEIHPHSNADRLQITTIFGASVIIDLSTKVGDIGIFFPIDIQLSEEYCKENNLVRKLDENGNNIGGYLDPDKRNIRALKLRGEKSEGLFMPLESLVYTGITKYEVGEKIDILNGHEICKKYIPKGKNRVKTDVKTSKTRKHSAPIAPLFAEHVDTEQLVYNLDAFKSGDQIEITLKMHGTSGRTGYLPKFVGYTSKNPLFRKILKLDYEKLGKGAKKIYDTAMHFATPIYDWGYVTGTRRVVLNDFENGGFYGSNAFREPHAKFFEGKLHKGETVYYEIVGFTTDGTPIMGSVPNSRVSDKKFSKQYGDTTTFSYGCTPIPVTVVEKDFEDDFYEKEYSLTKQSDMYVYRMTMTNEDGDVVEYTPDFMRYRCEQMGAKCVPVFCKATIDEEGVHMYGPNDIYGYPHETECIGDTVKEIAEKYYDGPDPIGKTHIREGVVIRIVNRPKFTAYKHKNFYFKVLEGIAKDIAEEPDMEEAQEDVNNS